MTHYTVTVCLEDDGTFSDGGWERALGKALAPFDENIETDPYKNYEDSQPAEHWYYKHLLHDADDYENHRTLPYKPDEIGWSSASSKQTAVQQRAEQKKSVDILAALPVPLTWSALAEAYNAEYGDSMSPGERLHVETGEDGTERAYTWSTYNPESKWDWYAVGGRWTGHFPYRPGAEPIIGAEPHWGGGKPEPGHCDGGPKRVLDLDQLREEAAQKATDTYRKYQAVVAGTEEALPWHTFADNVSEGGYTIDQARSDYNSQPRIAALQARDDFRWYWSGYEEFDVPEALYVERARASAVPGYATLTTDGRWMAPGRMLMFGMSTETKDDTLGYKEAANAYIESLDDSVWLIMVDCHI